VIINRRREPMRIGDGNHFMAGCREFSSHTTDRYQVAKPVGIEAASIGDHNTFKPKSKVSSQIVITDQCTFAAGTVTLASDPETSELETVPPHTVVYGALSERRVWDGTTGEAEQSMRAKEREFVREILPK
jgi:dynactin-6